MQYMSKYDVVELFRFVERQIVFTIESTAKVARYEQFMDSMDATVLFNSTCMCLQTIGETIRQIDERSGKKLFEGYPAIPWKQIIGMRNILSHEYMSIDPELVLDIVKSELTPLLIEVRRIIEDIEKGRHDELFERGRK